MSGVTTAFLVTLPMRCKDFVPSLEGERWVGIEERGAGVAAAAESCCWAVGVMQAIIWRKEELIPGEIWRGSDQVRKGGREGGTSYFVGILGAVGSREGVGTTPGSSTRYIFPDLVIWIFPSFPVIGLDWSSRRNRDELSEDGEEKEERREYLSLTGEGIGVSSPWWDWREEGGGGWAEMTEEWEERPSKWWRELEEKDWFTFLFGHRLAIIWRCEDWLFGELIPLPHRRGSQGKDYRIKFWIIGRRPRSDWIFRLCNLHRINGRFVFIIIVLLFLWQSQGLRGGEREKSNHWEEFLFDFCVPLWTNRNVTARYWEEKTERGGRWQGEGER
jgi:hypothetical protein